MAKFRDIIEGLEILAKYEPEGKESQIAGAGHDIIWVSDKKVSEDDERQLGLLGWHWNRDGDCWSHYC